MSSTDDQTGQSGSNDPPAQDQASGGTAPPIKKKTMCPHNKQKSFCKDCGGTGLCPHGKKKYDCKECGGSRICPHKKRKYLCVECGGSGTCQLHKKDKRYCGCNNHKNNKPQCPCGKDQYFCRIHGGGAYCSHGRQRSSCKACKTMKDPNWKSQKTMCKCGKILRNCKECGGSSFCMHGLLRDKCDECKHLAPLLSKIRIFPEKERVLKHTPHNTYERVGNCSCPSPRLLYLCCFCPGGGLAPCPHKSKHYKDCPVCYEAQRRENEAARPPLPEDGAGGQGGGV